jgi:hypothetical protein
MSVLVSVLVDNKNHCMNRIYLYSDFGGFWGILGVGKLDAWTPTKVPQNLVSIVCVQKMPRTGPTPTAKLELVTSELLRMGVL